jgi:Family of unknown function (DUF6461)
MFAGVRQDDHGWAWLRRGRRQIQGCVTFVRGATPERMLEEFGMAPVTARFMSLKRARELFGETEPAWVRIGRSREWAFAIEEISLAGAFEGVADRLSAGTEAAVLFWTAKPTCGVRYLADGDLVTALEPGRPSDRAGSDPDRFLAQMRQAGFEFDGSKKRLAWPRRFDPVIAAAYTLTLALGIDVAPDLVRAPLLTARCRADNQ